MWTVIPYRGRYKKFIEPIEAFKLYSDRIVNLLNGDILTFNTSENWQNLLDAFQEADGVSVIHFMYEFTTLTQELEVDPQQELAICIRYAKYVDLSTLGKRAHLRLDQVASINQERYSEQFERVYANLDRGNCYQINLTNQFKFQLNGERSPEVILASIWQEDKIGAYAHATYIPCEDRFLFSNSPECLFQRSRSNDREIISSMPIKGTVPFQVGDCLETAWRELVACKKNQSELDMITDLIRNDLSLIEKPRAKVVNRKSPLLVPGILHQFSQVEVKLDNKAKLSKIIKSLFPGGSITGAPKRRVVSLIDEIEASPRGFYCGSTYIGFEDFGAASINIRSFDMDLGTGILQYGAGGGITLQSLSSEEFEEMLIKVKSFSDLLSLI